MPDVLRVDTYRNSSGLARVTGIVRLVYPSYDTVSSAGVCVHHGETIDETIFVQGLSKGSDVRRPATHRKLCNAILWHSMVATTRCGIGRRHRADLAAGVGEVSERGRRGPTSLVARAARQRNAGASRRAADLIRSSTADVALTRTWKPASGHGQELRMRCFNPTS